MKNYTMNLQIIESSIFLKHWVGRNIGPKMRKSHEIYFQDKNEESKLVRENEISYFFKVISGMIELQSSHTHIPLKDLGFNLSIKDEFIEWRPCDKTIQFTEVFEGLFDLHSKSEKMIIFIPFKP